MDVHNLLSPPLAEAFERVYEADNDEEKLEAFASTWGGISEALLEKIIATGKGKDKVLALFAAGYAAIPSLENILLAHLHSPVQKERWAAALSLGSRKEERAFPFLEAMLQEGLVRDKTMQERTVPEIWEEHWYDGLRPRAVSLLADWKQPSLIPTMRHAFLLVWEAEKKGMPFLFGHGYQDALAYALGQRKAFGVLTGLDLPPTHFKTGMLYLALGYLQIRKRPPREGDLMINEKLQQEVAEVLQQYFGLSPDEHAEYIENF